MSAVQQSLFFPPPPPRAGQRQNLVIEAGAGTGKTTAIVGEVLKLMLERDDLALERVVLVTFTEKAAGEIADRIRGALEELLEKDTDHWPIGSPHPLVTLTDRDRARRALTQHHGQIDALRSQTIHSFCQTLLRTFPIEANLDPQFKIIEGFERSLLYGQLYDAWVDQETRIDARPEIVAEWELLFAHVGYLFQIRDLMFAMLDRRDLLNESGYDFGDVSDFAETALDALSAIRRTSDDVGDDDARAIWAYVREQIPPSAAAPLDAWIDYFAPIATHIREANLPTNAVLKEALKVLRAGETKGRSIHERLISHRAAMALLNMSRRFIDFLEREKRTLGVVDFDDLLLRTLAVLDDEAVLTRARGQFDFIFVDEFQDTDRTQARILGKLARDASGAFVPGRMIVVGDPKQSIYGFRRADPETYRQMTEEILAAGGRPQPLTDNYRSDPALLDAMNAMFARLFAQGVDDPNVFHPSYRMLASGKTRSGDAHARVALVHSGDDEPATVAEWIARHRDGSEFDLQRFAILLRRTTRLDDYLDALDRYDIPYVLPPTRLFLDRRAPVDLLAVLRAVAYPFDRGSIISAARTPYFALTDQEIVEGGAAWQEFQVALDALREAARRLTVAQLIELVVTSTAIEAVYAEAAEGVRHARHLEHVRAIAFEYDQKIGGSVRQFVDEISRRRTEPDEMEPALADETRNAVRILTVHAAKGLEFDTVILPDLCFPTSNADAMTLFTVDEPRSIVLAGRADSISANFRSAAGERLKKISGRREEAELRRLFYVAVTRAKNEVVFVCDPAAKKIGFSKYLHELFTPDEAMWPVEGSESREALGFPIAFERLRASGGEARRKRKRLRDATRELELANAPLSEVTIPIVEPVAKILAPAEIAVKRAGTRNRAAGLLLHRVLELWDGKRDPDSLLIQLAAEAAAEQEVVTRVRQRLLTIRRSPMLQRIAAAETLGRELPVQFMENGTLVERRIDRLLRERERDVVIDYKSGVPDEERKTRDGEQVAAYCRAIEALTGRACEGVLWYVDLESDVTVPV
ncbi:MAG TPA: UvrD-helicase domain-containing protein [Thermoanaerobaculia bacterium]|nr:UvrD-helicase domain-containing protein [Thermoanaerobaculia bacterium]